MLHRFNIGLLVSTAYLLVIIIAISSDNVFINTVSYVNQRIKIAGSDLHLIDANLSSNNIQTIHINNHNPIELLIAETRNTSTSDQFQIFINVIDRDSLTLIDSFNETIKLTGADADATVKCIVSAYDKDKDKVTTAICCEYQSDSTSVVRCELGQKPHGSKKNWKQLVLTRASKNIISYLAIDTEDDYIFYTNFDHPSIKLKDTIEGGFIASAYIGDQTLAIALRNVNNKNQANIYVCNLTAALNVNTDDACEKNNDSIRIDTTSTSINRNAFALGYVIEYKDENKTEPIHRFVIAQILNDRLVLSTSLSATDSITILTQAHIGGDSDYRLLHQLFDRGQLNLFLCDDSTIRCGIVRLQMAVENSKTIISGRIHITPDGNGKSLETQGHFAECQKNYYDETTAANCRLPNISATESHITCPVYHIDNGQISEWKFNFKTRSKIKLPPKTEPIDNVVHCQWPAVISNNYQPLAACCDYESADKGTNVDCIADGSPFKSLIGYRLIETNYYHKTDTLKTIIIDKDRKAISISTNMEKPKQLSIDINGKLPLSAKFTDLTAKEMLFAVQSKDQADLADIYWCDAENKCDQQSPIKIGNGHTFALDHVSNNDYYLFEIGDDTTETITFSTSDNLIRYAIVGKPVVHSIYGGNVVLIHDWSADGKIAKMQTIKIKFENSKLAKEFVPDVQNNCGCDGLDICPRLKPTSPPPPIAPSSCAFGSCALFYFLLVLALTSTVVGLILLKIKYHDKTTLCQIIKQRKYRSMGVNDDIDII